MKQFKSVNMALLTVFAGILMMGDLSAWERTAKDECKSNQKMCKKSAKQYNDGDKSHCDKQMQDCMKMADKKDEDSFMAALSPSYKKQFKKFSPDQKNKAMDYADDNDMSPDDAVAKVMAKKSY